MPQEIIDIHAHCFAGPGDAARVSAGLKLTRTAGLAHVVVVGLVNTHLDRAGAWNLVPSYVDHHGDPLLHEVNQLLWFTRHHAPALVPFVDTRHLWGDPTALLGRYIALGFRGIKGIYLADNGNDLGVASVPQTFGITLRQYHRREWEIFSFAEARGLPVVYHMDARRYADVMHALLADFPHLRIDLAHFGIGRKAFRKILDRHPNVYTDIASMLPYIRRDPKGYRDFILHYPDRVCFGSDAFLYSLETVLEYIRVVQELSLPPNVEVQVFSGNPQRFLGGAALGTEVTFQTFS